MAREQVFETGSEVVVIVELPGVGKGNIKIDINGGGIEISVEKGAEKKVEKPGLFRYESRYRSYRRYFSLPQGIDPKAAKATYRNGVLEVRMPKTKKAKEPKGFSVPIGP